MWLQGAECTAEEHEQTLVWKCGNEDFLTTSVVHESQQVKMNDSVYGNNINNILWSIPGPFTCL